VSPDEIVVVNDSTEQLSVTSELGASVVEEFTGGGKGPSAARNRGVARSHGELIAYLDDDDIWFPHHLSSALQEFRRNRDLDLYASTMLLAEADGLQLSTKVTFQGKEELIDFFYGRLCWARRRRAIPASTWVFRRDSCDLPMDETIAAHEDIWLLLNLDRRGRILRQSPTPGGVYFSDSARDFDRYTVDVVIDLAHRMESLRRGAGQRLIIGVVGRQYARKGLAADWVELMEAMPHEWVTSWDYRLIAAIEQCILWSQKTRRSIRETEQ
jgi:glycosyltransferase involved in cell wall biosynthesis